MTACSQDKKYVVIVSGLPRSGTSMMMKMLSAGGMPVVTDKVREPDEDNPGGYFELEGVKDLARDSSVLDSAVDKAVKIVSPLIFSLPLDQEYGYRIIFMERNLNEILASQRKMADRLQQGQKDIDEAELRKNYSSHLEEVRKWLAEKKDIQVMYVGYGDVINDPLSLAGRIAAFLQKELPTEEMARAVDRSLYRQQEHGQHSEKHSETPTETHSETPAPDSADDELIAEQLRRLGYL